MCNEYSFHVQLIPKLNGKNIIKYCGRLLEYNYWWCTYIRLSYNNGVSINNYLQALENMLQNSERIGTNRLGRMYGQ